MHTLSMDFSRRSNALNLGKFDWYIAKQEWQSNNPGNMSHFHSLVKNKRNQNENAQIVTADERVISCKLYENEDLQL